MPYRVQTTTHITNGPALRQDPVQRARARLLRALLATGDWTSAHPWLCLAAIVLVYLLSILGDSLALPLWHDELFTFFIAQAPSLRSLLTETRTVDLNPPLSYLLTRASFHLLGVGTLQARLPEILGFTLALTGLFLFVRREAGNTWGLFAAALLAGSKAAEQSLQARPYGLMLGLGACALAAWQASVDRDAAPGGASTRSHLLLAALVSLLLLTHVFALLIWAALLAGEAMQAWLQRRINVPRTLALLLPVSFALAYRPLIQSHGVSLFPPAFQPTPNTIFEFYIQHIDRELICLLLAALLVALIAGRSWLRGGSPPALTPPALVAAAALTAIPLLLIGWLIVHHGAFFDRYGAASSLGLSVLFAVVFFRWTGGRPAAALIAAIFALLLPGRLTDAISNVAGTAIFRHTEPVIPPAGLQQLTDPSVPLVDASGLTFLEMERREPASLLQRTFYLTGNSSAIDFAHATIFEGMLQEAALFHLRANVSTYPAFTAQYPRFFVLGTYDYPEDWLLRKLKADGATLKVVAHVGGSYKDHELYEVTMPSAPGTPRP